MRRIIEDGDRVYVLVELEAKRSVNPKASRKANELIIFGFNKRTYPELYRKYLKEIKNETNRNY